MSGTGLLQERARTGADGSDMQGLRAFITSPVSVDVRSVRQILERRGIVTFTADELDLPGRPLSEILREGMSRADIVVGVLGTGTSSENVLFELGFAQAMNKRTLVLVSGDAPLSTWASTGILYVRADLTNPQAVDFAVTQILKVPPQVGPRQAPARCTHPLGQAADQLLARWNGAPRAENEPILEEVVAQAIRLSGVDVASQSGGHDSGFDLAVWSEDLEPWVSNPLFIQLKANIGSEAELQDVVLKLVRTMQSTGVHWSLLIYGECPSAPERVIRVPNVLAISAEGFLRALGDSSFGELVRKLRNERVHGVR
jgi:hypothetical protein